MTASEQRFQHLDAEATQMVLSSLWALVCAPVCSEDRPRPANRPLL